MQNTYRNILVLFVLAFISVLGVTGCGDDSNDGNSAVVCEDFEAEYRGGEPCDSTDDCNSIPCPCADGSRVDATFCLNSFCGGAEYCESACGSSGYVCAE